MKTFYEKSKKILRKHKYEYVRDNYIYMAPVIIPLVSFDKETGLIDMEEVENTPVYAGSESVYKCEKCGRLKIIYYRKFKED